MFKNKIARDTLFLTSVSIILRVFSLILNVFITKKLGTATMGVTSLIYTFFGLTAVIASANIFLGSSRLISEEIGKKLGNPNKIFTYALILCITVSLIVTSVIFIFAEQFATQFLKDSTAVVPLRIMCLSLLPCSLSACFKGYFHAYRKVSIPAISDALEFLVSGGLLIAFVQFNIISNKISIFTAIALSICISEVVNCLYLCVCILRNKKSYEGKSSLGFLKFVCLIIPIMMNSYITVILSSVNEALLPLTLMEFSNSTETALSQYGILEAIIIPAIFFPSVILSCLSCILIPEISRNKAPENMPKVCHLTEKAIRLTVMFSIFILGFTLVYGKSIGGLLCNDPLAGNVIRMMSPVIPFIYLEIIFESILKGLGKHLYSTINYLAEYVVRISVLLICVPFLGFYGIIASYFASNIIGNISRAIKVAKITGVKINIVKTFVIPLVSCIFSWQIASLICNIINFDKNLILAEIGVYLIVGGIVYFYIGKVLGNTKIFEKKSKKLPLYVADV